MLNFVVALPCEAKPLIRHYRLKKRRDCHAFPVYLNAHIALIVSGSGKTSAAAACAFLQVYTGNRSDAVWINLGIAGHSNAEVGTMFVVDKITDAETLHNWYPQSVFKVGLPSACLKTVACVEKEYSEALLYDMEAAGFYPTALRFSTAELVHCIKLVSDNAVSGRSEITRAWVTELMTAAVESVVLFASELLDIAAQITSDDCDQALQAILQKAHFSQSQSQQLNQLLKRYQILSGEPQMPVEIWQNTNSSREILKRASTLLDNQPVNF